jgi:hypothetical protein
MTTARQKSNREAKKPNKAAAAKSLSATVSVFSRAPVMADKGRVTKGASPPA